MIGRLGVLTYWFSVASILTTGTIIMVILLIATIAVNNIFIVFIPVVFLVTMFLAFTLETIKSALEG